MPKDDTLRLAREAGFDKWEGTDDEQFLAVIDRFASLVAAAEREACAKVCDEEASRMEEGAQRAIENGEHDEVSAIRSSAWKLCVAANRIRARCVK